MAAGNIGASLHMRVIVVGAGIGGLTAALCLHEAGIDVEVFEQSRELAELGVGINLLPHATGELAALGLLPAIDRAGVRTRQLIYTNRFGQVIWREPRGTDAGYNVPQFSIHRGKLHRVLLSPAIDRVVSGRCCLGATGGPTRISRISQMKRANTDPADYADLLFLGTAKKDR